MMRKHFFIETLANRHLWVLFGLLMVPLLPIFDILVQVVRVLFTLSGKEILTNLWNERMVVLMGNSLLVAAAVSLMATLMGLILAYLLLHFDFPGAGLFSVLVIVPLALPNYIFAMNWIYLFGSQSWFTKMLMALFHLSEPPVQLSGLVSVIFCLTLWIFPLSYLFCYASLRKSQALAEAAALNSGNFKRIFRITLPLAWNGILAGLVFTFILALTNFSVAGSLQTNVFPVEIFIQFGAFFDHTQALLACLPLILIAFLLLLIQAWYSRKQIAFEFRDYAKHKMTRGAGYCLSALLFILYFLFILFPLLNFAALANKWQLYATVLSSYWRQLALSLGTAFVGALILTLMGFLLAYFSKWLDKAKELYLNLALFTLLTIPGTIYAISLIHIWNNFALSRLLYGTVFIIFAGFFRYLPLSYYFIHTTMRQLPREYEEASLVSGRSRLTTLLKILWPLCKPGLLGSFFVVLLFCFSELDSAVLINPPGLETLAVTIFSLLHYGATEQVAALSVINVIVIVFIFLIGWKWIRGSLNVRA